MPYTSLADLIDHFGEPMLIRLTDRGEVATGAIDTDVVDKALANTDAMIDGHIKARYALPLVATPKLIADLAEAIAIYKLHVYRADEKIEADYKDAKETLVKLSTGVMQLDIAGAEPETSGSGSARMTDRERPFTEDNMKGWI